MKLLLTIYAIFSAIGGLGTLLAPQAMLADPDIGAMTPGLTTTLRSFGVAILLIGLICWVARNAGPSRARNAIVVGITVGSGLGVIVQVLGLLGGAPAFYWIFVVFNAVFMAAFIIVGRANWASGEV